VSDKQRILIVDDTPANIKILNDLLRSQYHISVVTNGPDALQFVESEYKPDLILLDIMMPEMDGYEVCRRLKNNEETKNIPVLFVTAKSEVKDETFGLSLGAVDYITKPIEPNIIKARIKTHLELESVKKELQTLLNQTLSGSMRVLIEILSLFNPHIFNRSSQLRSLMKQIVKYLQLDNAWEYELAAMLYNIGYISFPAGLIDKLAQNEPLKDNEKKIFDAHPKVGARLIEKIPSLENISGMILNQNIPFYQISAKVQALNESPSLIGGHLLKIIGDFNELISGDLPPEAVIVQMQEKRGIYSPELLMALKEVLRISEEDSDIRMLKLHEITEGMILDENIYSSSKKVLLIRKGTELSDSVLTRLRTLEKIALFNRKIRIKIPKTSPDKIH
jgi:response regulator RpfG family c-di-GMP phosphodiesterase